MPTRKTKTKTPAKKAVVKKTTTTPAAKSTPQSSKNLASKINMKGVVIAVVVVLIVLALGYFKKEFVVATVNGQQINRIELIQALEQQDGQSVLNSLISQTLINQEAKRKNIKVSDQEINDEIKKIDASVTQQGVTLSDALKQRGLTMADLRKQVKDQLISNKLVDASNIKVSDKEINDYIEQNKAMIPAGSDMTQVKAQVKQQLQQDKVTEKLQTLVQELQQKAKITY
ncbi:MAG TPA: SurA N-terminal domain-containing protein [Patescibacteria group bacterium]|nr:SurA N-terminal domain-containing protein [Patescibacteria group bacterium]